MYFNLQLEGDIQQYKRKLGSPSLEENHHKKRKDMEQAVQVAYSEVILDFIILEILYKKCICDLYDINVSFR